MKSGEPTQPSSEHVALLYRLSRTLNSSLDLGKELNLVMDDVIAVTRAERSYIMLYESDGSLAFRVAREGRPALTSDAQSDDRFSSQESVMILGLRAISCVPLKLKEQVLGVACMERFQVTSQGGPAL